MKHPIVPCPCDLTAPAPERLGGRIRELRVDAELSRDELARRMGSYGPVVSRLESGRHAITTETLCRVAAALELDVATLVVVLDEAWCEGARHAGDEPWQRYERRKAELADTACSAAEYEAGLARIAAEEGV